MKKRILQKMADAIYKMVQRSRTKKDLDLWYNLGMKLDRWCVNRDIYLD